MSFIDILSDFSDFLRFFYDQVEYKTDFFEETNSKINEWYFLVILHHCVSD